jgi:hypothetical protein
MKYPALAFFLAFVACAPAYTTEPTSDLARQDALAMARQMASAVDGAFVRSFADTGSMKPLFGHNAFGVFEKADISDLRIGDIISFHHPRKGNNVVHMVYRKRGDGVMTVSIANHRGDGVRINQSILNGRLIALIYFSPHPET